MGGGKGRRGKGAQASEDPRVQNAVREKIERFAHDPCRSNEEVREVWGEELQTYKQYCRMYGIAMVKIGRGNIRLEKVDDTKSVFAELLELLDETLGPGECIEARWLLSDSKENEPDLWKRLTVKGITSCSEKKLMLHEDEVKRYFDVSPDWRFLARKGDMKQEFAKPIALTFDDSNIAIRKAVDAARAAVAAATASATGLRKAGRDMFCAFSPKACDAEGLARHSLAQRETEGYRSMLPQRERLPCFQQRDELLRAYEKSNVLVVCGATGCGKTTQLPQLIMESLAESGGGRVLCTQPRRISATSVAERVAAERGEELGDGVGYQIRFEHKAGPNTALLFCTVGIFLRHLCSNPTLEGVSVVVVDEVHERDVHTDFALMILRDLVTGPRPDLKLVLMSATIDASTFIDYFATSYTRCGGMLRVEYAEIPGKTNYPIDEFWAEDILRDIVPEYTPVGPPPARFVGSVGEEQAVRNAWASEPGAVQEKLPTEPFRVCKGIANMLRRPLNKLDVQLVVQVVLYIAQREGDGAILIFVPGWNEIADIVKELEKWVRSVEEKWHIFPLHSMVPPQDQRKIFTVPPKGTRKIIVSTNIAETSITVEDVVYVIDTGRIKGTTYTASTNVASLDTQLASRSNVQQRRGRAGRCQPGKFFKLYSRLEWEESMTDSLPPEMQRTPVEELCLQVRALELPGTIEEVLGKALAPPSRLAVANALDLLRGLGALDGNQVLTTLGWKLSAMPLHPALGKMLLLGSLFGCVPELLSVCATLSARNPFVLPFGKEREADQAKQAMGEGLVSDHLLFARVSADYMRMDGRERVEWSHRNFLSEKTLQMVESMRRDLRGYLDELQLGEGSGARPSRMGDDARQAELLAVLAASLPLASRMPSERKFKCMEASCGSCAVHPSSIVEWLSNPKGQRRGQQDDGEYSVLCWFSRIRTADLYLHDVSLIADMLPLLLLSPCVTRRPSPNQCVFEVAPPTLAGEPSDDDDDNGEDSSEEVCLLQPITEERSHSPLPPPPTRTGPAPESWEDDSDDGEPESAATPMVISEVGAAAAGDGTVPGRGSVQANTSSASGSSVIPANLFSEDDRVGQRKTKEDGSVSRSVLLLQVQDPRLADLLWDLRGHLQTLVDMIVGESPFRLPREVGVAFEALRELLLSSYLVHRAKPGALCDLRKGVANADATRRSAQPQNGVRDDSNFGLGQPTYWQGKSGGNGKGKSKGKGGGKKGKGGGYPWWEHLRP